jgi:hypothetical protein
MALFGIGCGGADDAPLETADGGPDGGRDSSSGDSSRDNNTTPFDAGDAGNDAAPSMFTVGGAVSGLAGATGLVLQLNGANNLSITADGNFVFPTQVPDGGSFSVTVGTQPTGKNCSVSAGSGKIAGANATGVVVNCAANKFTVGGTITGLAAGASVTLKNNGVDTLVRNANGSFAFATTIATAAPYAVTVTTQPTAPTQVCTVTNGAATMGTANVTNVTVTCVTTTFTVGGTISGLAAGAEVVLQNNGGNNLTRNANGAFTFTTPVASGAAYAVTVLTNPSTPAQTCAVTVGSGNVAAANVTTVVVTCTTTKFSVGGSLIGMTAGKSIVLKNNGGDDLTVNADGTFTFLTKISSGAAYAVTVGTQPAGQQCNVSAGGGNVGNANVTTVVVNCGNTFTVGGNVTGLGAGTVILQNNLGDTVNVSANAAFAFPTPLANALTYSVTVQTQPSAPTQTCSVTNASGTIAGANVTDVAVNCVTNTYSVSGTISGLAAGESTVLQNNLTGDITVSANGNFVFPANIASGAPYSVTVLTHPTGAIEQTCIVDNGGGVIGAANVSNVTVSCAAKTYAVGGNVSGLAAGATLVLQNNGGDNKVLTNNGAFEFATPIASGASYAATVLSQPGTPSQNCVVSAGSGPVTNAAITSIAVVCTTSSFTVGGSVTGLNISSGNVVKIVNNGSAAGEITVAADGNFTFAAAVLSGTPFAVTVSAQPLTPAQTCVVSGGTGTMGGSNVNTVVVNCATNTYTIGGSVTGLAPGNTVALRNNGGNETAVTSNTTFAFSTPIASGANYAVTVQTSPTAPISQTCTVTGGASGMVAAANITNVAITCVTNAFTIGGTITGLAAGDTVVLSNNGGNVLNVTPAPGTFTFSTPIPSGNTYNVQVFTNPQSPIQQVCTATTNTGTVANANVTDVAVNCVTTSYTVSGTLFGLAQGSITIQNNAGDDISMNANGSFSFPIKVLNGSPFSVLITSQPNVQEQICNVIGGSGTMPASNVTNVTIKCGWTCRSIHAAQPALPSGAYTIDPDGSGPIAQTTAYCDMSFDGGGWTLAESTTGGSGPTDGTAGVVTQSSATFMPINVMTALAGVSGRVHVRTSSGGAAPSVYVTSKSIVPMTNLRNGVLLNTGVAFGQVTRTQYDVVGQSAAVLDYSCNIGAAWPNVYHACNNGNGWHLLGATSSWNLNGAAEVPMEVYLQ